MLFLFFPSESYFQWDERSIFYLLLLRNIYCSEISFKADGTDVINAK